MKKRILSLIAAAAVAFSLTACTLTTPDTVGSIGETEIGSGMYLLCQLNAYRQAQGYADGEQSELSVKKFLKQTITVKQDGDEAGTEVTVSSYVADETLRSLQYYAAVKARFAEMGGELTAEELAEADSSAAASWADSEEMYTKNGIGLATLKEYEYISAMEHKLLEMTYGAEGTEPVSDEALTEHLQKEMIFGYYSSIPLYNTTSFALDEALSSEAMDLCREAADKYAEIYAEDAAAAEDGKGDIYSGLYSALLQYLPDIYGLFGNEFRVDGSLITPSFFTEQDLSTYYSAENGEKIRSAAVGEAVLLDDSVYMAELIVRADPLDTYTLDDLRDSALQSMKGSELENSLHEQGAALANSLSSASMNKLPVQNIVL